jgi:hypothetical protein
MMGSIGLTVGLIGYCLFGIIELLSTIKYQTVRCAKICVATPGGEWIERDINYMHRCWLVTLCIIH